MPELIPARSYLYAPGDRPERFDKAASSGADAVVLDLEDGVGPQGKDAAHQHVAAAARPDGVQWWVRLDPARLDDGVAAAVVEGTTGVLVPGAEAALLERVAGLLHEAERSTGTAPLAVIGLIETARGVADVRAVAASPRVHRIGLGEADLAAELGMAPDPDRRELWPIRSEVVVASALAGVVAPVGPVQTDLVDEDLLARSTEQLVRQGFAARTLLHPRQVGVVHRHLAPSPRQLADAQRVIHTFDDAEARGQGIALDDRGRMIDLAVVRSARAVLARAQR